MCDIRSAITSVFMGIGFPNVTLLSLRKVRKPLPYLQSHAKPAFFCKVQMLFASETCKVMARESDRSKVLYYSLNDITDEILITELKKCGYNLDRQREGEKTAEIFKIS